MSTPFNPFENLRKQQALAEEAKDAAKLDLQASTASAQSEWHDLVEALDDWLARGGFLPDARHEDTEP